MSTSNASKPKSRGFRNLFRDTFNRSSQPSPPPQLPSVPASSSEPANKSYETVDNSDEQDVPTDQRPIAIQSMSAPAATSAKGTNSQPTLSPVDTPDRTRATMDSPREQNVAAPIQPVISSLEPTLLPANTPTAISGASITQITNPTWIGLRASLRALRDTPGVFGPLTSVAGVLLDCFDAIEVAARNQKDYEDLARELAALSESLAQHFKGAPLDAVSECVSSVTMRLGGLNPEKQATYDSKLSATVNRRTCTEGTRMEILGHLANWAYDRDGPSVYWMNGMAGTGKTTIACTFSEWLEHHELLAASFFCTRTSADCRDVSRIIPTVVYQLARYSASFQSTLCDILGAEPDAGSKNISKQFERLLNEPLRKMKEAMVDDLVVVVDALDECDDQNGVETILDMLFRYASDLPLKFFVTSRPEPEIYEKMALHAQSRTVIHLQDIEKSLVRADIELYLKEELKFMSPSPSDIEQLVDRSGALFIYAATLARYIQPSNRRADPHKRLRSVLGMTAWAVKEHAQIDALYTAVLNSALSEEELEADETRDVRIVLSTVLLAQEPISTETIAKLAGIDEPRRVEYALLPLRSVLHQSEITGLVSTLHASFPDFMFNNKRSGSYFCDIVEHSELLAQRCFLILEEQLRFNICDLESSFIPDAKVQDVQNRLKNKISPSLTYACRHWASHLKLTSKSDDLFAMLDGFLSRQLLFWMEVLSLRREMPTGIEGLVNTKQWLARVGHVPTNLVLLAEDACNFVIGFASSPVSQSTPHIYISSLPFCPRSSFIYKHYWNRTQGLLELKGSLMKRRETAELATWNIGSPVLSVAYSPDGSRVVVGCGDDTVRILNAYNGTPLVEPLKGHTMWVESVAFSPDGRFVASGSLDNTIRIWNVHNGTLFKSPLKGHTGKVVSLAFSPDGTRLVSGSGDTTIRVWDLTDGTPLLGPLQGTDSQLVPPNGVVRVWNSRDGTPTASFRGHNGITMSVVFTPDGSRLVSGSSDRTICVWSVLDGSPCTHPFTGHTDTLNSVIVSPDGTRVSSGSNDNTIRVWKIDDGTPVAGPFVGHTSDILSVAYSPDGTRVISGSRDKTIRVWNIRDGLLLPTSSSQPIVSHTRLVLFSPDSSRIWSSSTDNVIRIWDPSHGSFTTGPHDVQFLSQGDSLVSPDGSHICTTFKKGPEEGPVSILSTADWSLVAGPFGNQDRPVRVLRFSPDSTTVIMGFSDGNIQVYPIRTGQVEGRTFNGHQEGLKSVALSYNCSLAVSYSLDETLRVWDVLTPTLDLDSHPITHHFSAPYQSSHAIPEGWKITEEGWVINSNKDLLFWIPPDLTCIHAWPSPHTKLIITDSGTLEIPKQKVFLGEQWSECYVPE
ncbi:unnamed protein product [Rhizoctonia solani]|uniref:NACHT domain-containing protein n=1 Tax=Rhizoctonia solani TaxID=456999 RepID=A0A8H3AJY7_9AGAM|nr:unnamed protein product [Rhizoctonia solani]